MGVEDLLTPYIRDSKGASNINLKDVTKTKDIVLGIDMSVIIIQMMRAKPTIIESYHMNPIIPLTELEIQVVEKVKRYIDKYGVKKVVCVFDGMPNKLKKETAYIKRYAKNELLNNRLNELYEKANFDVMPQPVHELMQLVIPLEYMYPKNTSERRIQEKQNSSRGSNQGRAWRSRSRRKKRTSRSW